MILRIEGQAGPEPAKYYINDEEVSQSAYLAALHDQRVSERKEDVDREEQPPPAAEQLEEMAQQFFQALQPLAQAVQQMAVAFTEALEDALRDNAYHPTGPVVRSTATVIDEDVKRLPEPKQ